MCTVDVTDMELFDGQERARAGFLPGTGTGIIVGLRSGLVKHIRPEGWRGFETVRSVRFGRTLRVETTF